MTSRYGRALRILYKTALAAVVVFAVLLVLCVTKVMPWPQQTIELKRIRAAEGFAYTSKLPAPWPGFAFVPESGILTESGRAMTPADGNGVVREKGMGAFRVGGGRVLFSASDGSDPLKNGRTYSLHLDAGVLPSIRMVILLAGGFAVLLLFGKSLSALASWLLHSVHGAVLYSERGIEAMLQRVIPPWARNCILRFRSGGVAAFALSVADTLRFPKFVSACFAVLATTAALVLFPLLSGSWCDQMQWLNQTIELRDIRQRTGLWTFTAELPPSRWGFTYAVEKTLLHDGGQELRNLPEGVSLGSVPGYFRHVSHANRETILFRSADGSDPRVNGRTYMLRVQQTPSLWLVGALALLAIGGWLLAGCCGPSETAPAPTPGFRIPLLIFFVAVSIRLIFLWLNPLFSDGLFAIQGVPFSDAKGWNSMAQSLIEGHGLSRNAWWSPKRPLFSICLALLYTWTGDSLIAAKCLLAVITAGTAALVFLVFRRVAPLWVAVAAGLFIAFDRREVETVAVLQTEPLGIFLAVASIWALIVGFQEKAGRWFFLAGVFFACSNLARPLTLPAFPMLIALIAAHSLLAAPMRLGALFRRCALFAVGTFICLTPWLVRQRVVHGMWAVSDNTASALFAASSPEFRTWSPKVEEEAVKDNVPHDMTSLYRYFNRRFRENLEKYPGYYFSHIIECLPQAVWQSNMLKWGSPLNVFGAAALAATGLTGAIARRRRDQAGSRFALLAGLLALGVLALTSGAGILLIATLGFVWCFRAYPAGASVLAVTFAGAVLAAALFGNAVLNRTRVLLEWVEIGWFFAGLYGIGGILIAEFCNVPSRPAHTADAITSPQGHRARSLRFVLGVGAFLLCVTSARLIFRTLKPLPDDPVIRLSEANRLRLVREIASRHPELKALGTSDVLTEPRDWQSRLFVEPVRLERHVYWFPRRPEVVPREEAGRRYPLRDHPYTAFSCKATEPPMSYEYEITGLFAGPLPPSLRGQVCVAIGLIAKEPVSIRETHKKVEILALIPGPNVETAAIEHATVAPMVPETQRLIEALAASSSGLPPDLAKPPTQSR